MTHFVGGLEYLSTWRWHDQHSINIDEHTRFLVSSLPLMVDVNGQVRSVGDVRIGQPVFSTLKRAVDYMEDLMTRDLDSQMVVDHKEH